MKETTILNFGSSSSSDIGVLEVDPTLNLDSDGNTKSTFYEGEKVYMSLHYDPSLYYVDSFECTAGSLLFQSRERTLREITQQFIQEESTDLQYIIDSIKSVTWYSEQQSLNFTYSSIKINNPPAMVDLEFYIMSDIYLFVPNSTIDLTNYDTFPVGMIFNLENR